MFRKSLFALIACWLLFAAVWVVASGFTRNEVMLNAACDPTRELWRDVNEAFIADYEATHGVKLHIRQSHGGSGSQARAVTDGLPADVVTLALFTDTDQVRKAGLIGDGWEGEFDNRSLPYTSTIVFVVRKGNPKGIADWPDLAKGGVSVITPNPKTSGNGKWSFLALWGSVIWRKPEAQPLAEAEAEAERFVADVFRRVPVLDPAARGATMTFAQKKIGDVHLTWENEAHLEVKEANGELEIVYPPLSVLAEPHVAVVDRVVDRKGTRAAAEAYLNFLYKPEAQEIIARHYHRPTNKEVLARWRHQFPDIRLERATTLVDRWKEKDERTNWDELQKRFFAEGGVFDRIPLAKGAK